MGEIKQEKKEQSKSNMSIWKPVMIFYAKATSWILMPILLVIVLNKLFFHIPTNATSFFILMALGFGISCSGIYKEIKKYQKTLENKK